MSEVVKSEIRASIETKQKILEEQYLLKQISSLAFECLAVLQNGGKVIFAGNGGSFADSQHLAAEFVSRFKFDRGPLPAITLGTNSSTMSATGNDYGYDQIFARELAALGDEKDIFIPITTSGNSSNILRALEVALSNDIKTVALTGGTAGALAGRCECIIVPSSVTARIQESHILIGHIICGIVEGEYFKKVAE